MSRAQVAELHLDQEVMWVETMGDQDQETSLRTLEKTDFFTRELDQMLLSGEVDVTIHSAKDLPEPLPEGLKVLHITDGVDPTDSLVYSAPLPKEPHIATSSVRREEAVKELFPNATFSDIRGTIEERLKKLGEVDGVVIAEAAIIRLGLTHLTRLRLPGETHPLQGKIALLIRE